MPQERQIRQHTQEISFKGIEPVGSHTVNAAISGVVVLDPPDSEDYNNLIMQALDQNVYYTLDGTAPIPTGTATGFLLKADDPPVSIPIGQTTIVSVVEGAATARLQYQWSR